MQIPVHQFQDLFFIIPDIFHEVLIVKTSQVTNDPIYDFTGENIKFLKNIPLLFKILG